MDLKTLISLDIPFSIRPFLLATTGKYCYCKQKRDFSFFLIFTDKFKPLLNHLLYLADEQNAFSDTEIREHLNTFVIAAYDTSTVSLTLLLMMIGWHKGVQERVYNEYVSYNTYIF